MGNNREYRNKQLIKLDINFNINSISDFRKILRINQKTLYLVIKLNFINFDTVYFILTKIAEISSFIAAVFCYITVVLKTYIHTIYEYVLRDCELIILNYRPLIQARHYIHTYYIYRHIMATCVFLIQVGFGIFRSFPF